MAQVIKIHTDGCSLNNQKADRCGGWAAVLEFNGKSKVIGAGMVGATNNQMELTAVVEALKAVKADYKGQIEIYADSQYVCDGINTDLKNWMKNGWKTSAKKPVANKELWEQFLLAAKRFPAIEGKKRITVTWIPREQNAEADKYSKQYAQEAKIAA